jgi:hypothetical protein
MPKTVSIHGTNSVHWLKESFSVLKHQVMKKRETEIRLYAILNSELPALHSGPLYSREKEPPAPTEYDADVAA